MRARTAPAPTREDAIRAIAAALDPAAVVVAANGHVSRGLHAVAPRPGTFYMIGSMGLAPSIGLGIALARPTQPVVVLDGDGNVLMNLGALAQVGARRPPRFAHICLDNGSYSSTGGQPTLSASVRLEEIAAAAGYAWTGRAADVDAVHALAREALAAPGPAFLLVEIAPGGLPSGTPRVELEPPEIARRTRRALGG